MLRYFIIYKPYNTLSQFTTTDSNKKTLKDYFTVPTDCYAVGRLDYDSEGLLILTNDTFLNKQLLHPNQKHKREYWVQVDGAITQQALVELCNGVEINIDGTLYITKRAIASFLEEPILVPERVPPIRVRKNIPAPWIKLILTEGKNRQVRKMTAKVGFPTLRLIRHRIEGLTLNGLQPGQMQELSKQTIYKQLFGK